MRISLALLMLVLGLVVARQFLAPTPPAPLASTAIIPTPDAPKPALVAPPVQVTKAAVDPAPAAEQPQELVLGLSETTAGADAGDASTYVPEAVLACQQIWDPSTHMSQAEWAQSCRRVDSKTAETGEDAGRPPVLGGRW